MKATSFDIAYRAGVSQSTVSRALRNSPLVNKETRLKVQAIAKELNYKVDKNARSLRSQQSYTIALLLFEDPSEDNASQINPFFLSMLGSITSACSNKGYDLLVSFQKMESDWHAEYADTNKADGIILLGYGDYLDYKEKLIQLNEQHTHFVRWGAEVKDMEVATIGCDNLHGGYQLTQHLVEQGCKNPAFVGVASSGAPEFEHRYLGFKQALKDANMAFNENLQVDAVFTEEAGYTAAKELLSKHTDIDAIFGASDLLAIGALRAIKEQGYRVPEDIAVVGFDDIVMANFTNPPLTTAKQDTILAGQLLVDSLLAQIAGEKPKSQQIQATLVERKSSNKLNK